MDPKKRPAAAGGRKDNPKKRPAAAAGGNDDNPKKRPAAAPVSIPKVLGMFPPVSIPEKNWPPGDTMVTMDNLVGVWRKQIGAPRTKINVVTAFLGSACLSDAHVEPVDATGPPRWQRRLRSKICGPRALV